MSFDVLYSETLMKRSNVYIGMQDAKICMDFLHSEVSLLLSLGIEQNADVSKLNELIENYGVTIVHKMM